MATITKRDSGYWQAKVRRKGWPVESKTFRTKTEAEAWAKQIESDITRGTFVSASDSERTTLGELIERFTNEYAPLHYRPRKDKKEAWRFQCAILQQHLGSFSLAAIDQKLVAKYRDDRLAGRERDPVAPSSVRKELYMLSKVLRFAESECGIPLPRGNPVTKIRKPTESRSRDRRLSAEEWQKLQTECNRSQNKLLWPAVVFSLETAVRQGELINLRWEHVDIKRRIALLTETKTNESRSVPLSTVALNTLNNLPTRAGGRVFPIERQTLYRAFVRACIRAGIDDYNWHDLRHESISRLAERGDLSVLELSAVSGHKTLAMLKRYTHLQAERLAEKLG